MRSNAIMKYLRADARGGRASLHGRSGEAEGQDS